ncbi:histidinol-phosphatase HisJ family protein [Clostridiaceae bacterium 35-E11]
MHTNFSADCDTPMEDIIKQCVTLGVDTVMLTDHVDFDYPDDIDYEVDFTAYRKEIQSLKEKYPQMKILMGVEIGYMGHLQEKLNELIDTYPFDFVIGSIHAYKGKEFCKNGFFNGKTQKESYQEYFEAVRHMVADYDNFDVVGHLDFIVRYGDFLKKELSYRDFQEMIDEILMLIIQKGKGIELNTSGIRYGLDVMHPSKDILKKYLEMGGEIITLGSDSHRAKDLFRDFDQAIKDLKAIGFQKITQFKQRQPHFIKI